MNVEELMVSDSHEEGFWLTLQGPDGKEVKGARMLLVGPYSDTYQQRQTDYYRANVHKAAAVVAASEGDKDAANEVATDDTMLLQCSWFIKDWEGLTDRDGNEFECTEENRIQLLTKAPYIKSQAYQKWRKTENFTGS